MDNLLSFELSRRSPVKEFSFRQQYSYISIKKINITSLSGRPEVWSAELFRLNPIINIKCERGGRSFFITTLNILTYISPYHFIPVIEFSEGFIIPQSNTINPSGSRFPAYDSARLELTYTLQDREDLRMNILYEKTQGVYDVNLI